VYKQFKYSSIHCQACTAFFYQTRVTCLPAPVLNNLKTAIIVAWYYIYISIKVAWI